MTTLTPEWMTVAEACAYLRVTRSTLYRWAAKGLIRLHKIGPRSVRVSADDLAVLAEGRDWSGLSHDAFTRDWDNDDDAVYDNWRELYGVQQG